LSPSGSNKPRAAQSLCFGDEAPNPLQPGLLPQPPAAQAAGHDACPVSGSARGFDKPTAHASVNPRVAWQLGYYFSTANLRTDHFLKQWLGSDGTSPVSTSLIASFPRLNKLGASLDEVVDTMRSMELLHVSADGAWVRRAIPLGGDSDEC